jgi:hypothetical protein
VNENAQRTYSDEEELKELEELAERLGLKLDEVARSGSEANLVGLRSEYVLLSRRIDSRTYFVHDTRYGVGREAGAHTGPHEHLEACRRILGVLGIPVAEIGDEQVLIEQMQVAQVDRDRKVVHREEVEEGRRVASLSRQFDGLPVWSSTMLLGLTEDGGIGYLQLHWPELHTHVIHEAKRLRHKLTREWEAPAQPRAEVETIEAGVVHSPAVAFCMDIYPAIRVIYRPSDPRLGQKVVLHLDRHGKQIPAPRQAELPFEEPQQRPGQAAAQEA